MYVKEGEERRVGLIRSYKGSNLTPQKRRRRMYYINTHIYVYIYKII